MEESNQYKERGHDNRAQYLDAMADEYGLDPILVHDVADLLGEIEDFDGLISALKDMEAGQ